MPGLAAIKSMKDVKSWLEDVTSGWIAANTDGIKPEIKFETEVTESQKNTGDHVIVDNITEIILPFGIGGEDWRHDVPIAIQCRTKRQFPPATYLDHLEKIGNEAARIIKARVTTAGYSIVTLTGSMNKSREPYDPYILDIALTLVKINP